MKTKYLNQNQIHNLEELFALPLGLKLVATLDGREMYSSDKLKQKYIEAMSKTGRAKKIVPILTHMIKNKTFIPAFTNKNLFKLIKYKVFPGNSRQGIMGFYSFTHKVIVICMDHNIEWGFANNDWMARLTIHEGMHKCGTEAPATFMSLFKKDLENYYAEVFKRIFSLKSRPKEMSKIVEFLFYKCELVGPHKNSVIMSLFKILQSTLKKYTTLNPEEFEKILRDYIVTWKIYSRSPRTLMQNIRQYIHIIRPLAVSYKDVFGKIVLENFYVQEIGIPSEVIAVRSEILPDAKTIKAFSVLK